MACRAVAPRSCSGSLLSPCTLTRDSSLAIEGSKRAADRSQWTRAADAARSSISRRALHTGDAFRVGTSRRRIGRHLSDGRSMFVTTHARPISFGARSRRVRSSFCPIWRRAQYVLLVSPPTMATYKAARSLLSVRPSINHSHSTSPRLPYLTRPFTSTFTMASYKPSEHDGLKRSSSSPCHPPPHRTV